MHTDLKQLSERFRKEYYCNDTPGAVEKMFATIAGRDVNSTEDFTKAQLAKMSNFLRYPPFKPRHTFTKSDKIVFGTLLAGAVLIGAVVGLTEN